MKIRIYYEDTDAGGIVYHTNYIKFCERARSEAFFQAGLNFTKEGGYFVVSSLEAKFIASAMLGDEVFVRTKILELKKASLVLEQEIYKFDDKNAEKLLFRATITL
ncbi:MAG: YbgC/FadM family acyl-CoA thioesterase, partial [Campylobacter concisus]